MPDYSNDSPMELLYIWINSDETGFIQQQGFNFSPNYEFKMKQNSQNQYELTCTEYPDYRNVWNINRGKHQITNLTAIVGNNGSGKTSLLRHLANASILPIEKDDDSFETDIPDDSYECTRMVLIFRCGTNIRILYNFEENEELKYDNSKYAGLHISKENYSDAKELLDNHTTIYLSNAYSSSRSVWESEWGQTPIIFSPTGNYERADLFFKKICGLNLVNELSNSADESSGLNEDEPVSPEYSVLDPNDKLMRAFYYLQENIASHKNYKDFERLCAISRYHHLHSEESSATRMITDSKDLIIGVANFYTLTNQSTNKKSINYNLRYLESLSRIQYKFKRFQRESRGTDPIHSVLSFYLSLEQDYLLDASNSTISNTLGEYYNNSYFQIENLISILDDDSVKPVPRNRRVAQCVCLKHGSEAYNRFCEFIDQQMKREHSFVLKYLTIEIPPQSSGEQALQNIFSWLRLPPYFKEIFGEKSIPIKDNILLLLDEVDLYMHPEWQRQFLHVLSQRLEIEYPHKHVQIIISTHSPLVLSDIPLRNTIYLDKSGTTCTLADRTVAQESFGANLFSLLKDSFFLKKTIGEFSYAKISEVFEDLTLLKRLITLESDIQHKKDQELIAESEEAERSAILEKRNVKNTQSLWEICQKYDCVIQIIGEPVIRRKLQVLYSDIFRNDEDNRYKQDLEKLNQLLECDDTKKRKQYRELLAKIVSESSSI